MRSVRHWCLHASRRDLADEILAARILHQATICKAGAPHSRRIGLAQYSRRSSRAGCGRYWRREWLTQPRQRGLRCGASRAGHDGTGRYLQVALGVTLRPPHRRRRCRSGCRRCKCDRRCRCSGHRSGGGDCRCGRWRHCSSCGELRERAAWGLAVDCDAASNISAAVTVADPRDVADHPAVRKGLSLFLLDLHRGVGHPAQEVQHAGTDLLDLLRRDLKLARADLHRDVTAQRSRGQAEPLRRVRRHDEGAFRNICRNGIAGSGAWPEDQPAALEAGTWRLCQPVCGREGWVHGEAFRGNCRAVSVRTPPQPNPAGGRTVYQCMRTTRGRRSRCLRWTLASRRSPNA